jgi:arylformamidase
MNGQPDAALKAALDLDFSPSKTVERIEHYIWLYAEQSRLARAAVGSSAQLGLAYGPDERHVLDYFPCAGRGAPLVVFIHGGFWQALSKDFASFPAPAMRAGGVNYVAISYRLGETTRLDGIVHDVVTALAFLVARAPELGFDTGRIVLAGHSAGAHLAAMAAVRGVAGLPALAGLHLIGGVFNLLPVRLSYVNDVMRMDEAEALRNSPAHQTPLLRCPVAMTWAEHETPGFHRQSQALAAAWRLLMPALEVYIQPGLNHFNSLMDLADPGSRMTRATLDLAHGKTS